jgi:hypothetical protein
MQNHQKKKRKRQPLIQGEYDLGEVAGPVSKGDELEEA